MKYRHRHIKPKLNRLKPKKRFFSQPWFWILAALAIVFGAIGYVAFFYPKLQITEIHISGNQAVPTQALEQAAWQGMRQSIVPAALFTITTNSMLFADASYLEEIIADQFPLIKEVHVRKNWPQGLTIEIVERQPFAVFCPGLQNVTCFYIDDTGVIFQEAQKDDAMPVLYQSIDGEPLPGDHAVGADTIDAIVKVNNSLSQHFGVGVAEVAISNPLVFTTSEAWKIYVDPDEAISLQVAKMEALLKTEISAEARKNLQYLYLQYKDRAYYK